MPHRIPWFWGTTKNRDHVHWQIDNNNNVHATNPFDLSKTMAIIWRVKKWKFSATLSATGRIRNTISDPLDNFSISKVFDPFFKCRGFTGPVGMDPLLRVFNDERHLFGQFEAPINPPSNPERSLHDDGFNFLEDGTPASVPFVISTSPVVNWDTEIEELWWDFLRNTPPFPFRMIRSASTTVQGVLITFTAETPPDLTALGTVGASSFTGIGDPIIGEVSGRFSLSGSVHDFFIDSMMASLDCEASDFYPFRNLADQPVYDATGAQINDPFG